MEGVGKIEGGLGKKKGRGREEDRKWNKKRKEGVGKNKGRVGKK